MSEDTAAKNSTCNRSLAFEIYAPQLAGSLCSPPKLLRQEFGQPVVFLDPSIGSAHPRQTLLDDLQHHALARVFAFDLRPRNGQLPLLLGDRFQPLSSIPNKPFLLCQIALRQGIKNPFFALNQFFCLCVQFLKQPGRQKTQLLLQFQHPSNFVSIFFHQVSPVVAR
ncbi:MAG: hypothetical protein ABJH93_11195 [Roseibium sp.]|uniref:hypothetical protein n=1 Tax=Roseibium sp. TaxID=1936156 RepID=UPI0032969E04